MFLGVWNGQQLGLDGCFSPGANHRTPKSASLPDSWAPCKAGSEPSRCPAAVRHGQTTPLCFSFKPPALSGPGAPEEKMLPAVRSQARLSANSLKARLSLLATPARKRSKNPVSVGEILPLALSSVSAPSQRGGGQPESGDSNRWERLSAAASQSWGWFAATGAELGSQSIPAASPSLGKATGKIPAGANTVKVQPWSWG